MAEQRLEPKLSTLLLRWYDAHGRQLPWRQLPGLPIDPYHVWISEIMLQQTTVATVKTYYDRFLTRWPTLADLARADQEEVLQLWSGLGYYSRARNLHACAQQVVASCGGKLPETAQELQHLPGIGPYTSAAIAAIAFDEPCAAVDGNVERVIARLYALPTPLPSVKPEIKKRAQALVPQKRAGDFAQALMDLGATVCTPKNPNCPMCPWTEFCCARKDNLQALLPRRVKKPAKPTRRGLAYVIIRDDGSILLGKRPEVGLLANMLEVPSSEWGDHPPSRPKPPMSVRGKKLAGFVTHTFTHFHLVLEVWKAQAPKTALKPTGDQFRWVKLDELDEQALPTLMHKVIAFARTATA